MSDNDELLEERDWLSDVLSDYDDLELTDRGLGMGQADLCYERDCDDDGGRRRVSLTIRIEDE
jgi:hypothetical protein